MEKKVGIIMVNYKDYADRFLAESAASVFFQIYPVDSYRLYIVDNASSEASRQSIGKICPSATIIHRIDGNYCAANNAGAKQALVDGCKYLVFANMDTVFDGNWLKELTLALDSDASVGVAQSKILLYQADKLVPEKINSLGNIIHFLFFGFTRGNGRLASEYEEYLLQAGVYPEIGYASGCSLIIRCELFSQIGGYDENLYMYHDDVDLSLKVKLTGRKVVLAPHSILWHKYEFSRSVRMLYYMERNRHIAFFSFYPIPVILLLLLPMLVMDCGVFLYSIKNGWLSGSIKVVGYFFKLSSWRDIAKRRQALHKIYSGKVSRFLSSFSGRIDFQEINNPLLKLANPVFDLYWKMVRKII
jgi:hypothetical protein